MQYSNIFSPIKLRELELNGRIVMSSMVTKLAKNRYVTQELIDYHVARAKGGLCLNFLEASSVHEPSASASFISIGDDKYLPKLKELTNAVHEAGGKIGIQFWQGGMVASMLDPNAECFIPSEISLDVGVLSGAEPCEAIFPAATVEKIHEVQKCYGEAAKRAVEAGFDAIEIHASHGYSGHVFLSAAFNNREDEYGGSFENRSRFLLECIDEVRNNIPESMPLFMRIAAKDDSVESGMTIEDTIAFCKLAKAHGVDVLNVTRGNSFTSGYLESAPIDMPRGFNVENAAKIRKETGMITIAVGHINDPDQAEAILSGDKADLVVMSRSQLADSCFCNKVRKGRVDDIVRCVGCNQGCNDIVATLNPEHITCLMNPAVCREKDFEMKEVLDKKKVLIVGGGIAGIVAAELLYKRGAQVTLIEKSNMLGGQFVMAGKAPRKAEFITAIESRARQIQRVGVKVCCNTTLTEDLLNEIKPNEIIFAVGASPIIPNIPGNNRHNVYKFDDILNGYILPEGKVAVIGGGLVGLEVSEYLKSRNREVTVIEMLEEVGAGLGSARRIMTMPEFENVDIHINTKCIEIINTDITVEVNGEQTSIPADSVVFAIGSRSNDLTSEKELCDKYNISYHVIGDANKVRRAIDAVAEAANVVLGMK
ncbi:2,4-dienoyl-CoA reductase-like NADH-dependent reductase (Old Yellow Enzyme family) [Alkalibaculum bacchi]|uniref:2,4-dienoyl-CoA reductase-like NADH-dependent reductase (Old Yellow Enzyme family) n=1 Tax=Alkalibaculum bacchi TaxID=645887 RepID=A0A366HYG5_9FIRM|nr:NAD(P)/FAD-dependent oxidoreductase [Alkalibaculum bacchi]RBP57460.1 2,4-dienoyl-CoA reductase-like NADH-dependent reductase (Old Yellow Enzyme family) [Alkalibaculum bacchi]